MSTTMQSIDARAMLSGWLQGVTHMFQTDLQAIPDDKWTATFGGCTRPCNELAEDTIGFLFWAALAIQEQGTPTIDDEKKAKLTAECATKAGATALLQKASKLLGEAITSASEDTLLKTATAPWGMESTLYNFAQMAVSHVWYHDGQLNYVQCLLGDAAYHWNEH